MKRIVAILLILFVIIGVSLALNTKTIVLHKRIQENVEVMNIVATLDHEAASKTELIPFIYEVLVYTPNGKIEWREVNLDTYKNINIGNNLTN